MDLPWYVLRSKPTKEMTLWRELTARGFECFYPRLHVHPVNPRSRKTRPYLPGYLFLQADIEELGASTFQWMPFSSGLVSFDGIPATVAPGLVQALRQHLDEINAVDAEVAAGPKHDDPVVVQSGPFEGYEAIFDVHLAGTERVRVLLKILQVGQIRLELPATQIQPKK